MDDGGSGAGVARCEAVAGDGAASPAAGGGRMPGGAAGLASPSSRGARTRQASRTPPSAYRISRSARRPGCPYRLRSMVTPLRRPTTSRPSRIQPAGWSSSHRPLASWTAAARLRPSDSGSSTTSSAPARRASAASRPSRSPTRFPAIAGSRPSGRSTTSRSTVRAARSDPDIASASSRSAGVRTTSHSGLTPRATASTGSNERARSSHATIAPPACASAATRSASVVLPELALPRSATVAERGRPPVPRIASSAANPVETMRPSASRAGAPRRAGPGTRGPGPGTGWRPGVVSSSGASSGWTARASAPSVSQAGAVRVPSPSSSPRRGAAPPQRAWSVASAWETSDERAIGRRIIERMFYCVKVSTAVRRPDCQPVTSCIETWSINANAAENGCETAPSRAGSHPMVGRQRRLVKQPPGAWMTRRPPTAGDTSRRATGRCNRPGYQPPGA
jgi:hypothetical protein